MKRMRLRRSKRLWREMKSGAGLLWWREPPGRKTMQALSDRLEDEWLRGLRVLKRRSEQPDELEGVHEAQVHLSRAMVAVGRLVDRFPLPADILVVGVDNNACRRACSRHARTHRIPAVFTMLSLDGMRCQSFLQGPNPDAPCPWCALLNLDPEKDTPCATSIVTSRLLASSIITLFAQRAVMGQPDSRQILNWCEVDLRALGPTVLGRIKKLGGCRLQVPLHAS